MRRFPDKGVYRVCLTVSNPYGTDTHRKTLYLGVSAQDNPVLQAQVQVWPNPLRDRPAVALSANPRSPMFRLYDTIGRLMREERLVLGVNEIEADSLAAVTYFRQVTSGGEVVKSGKINRLTMRYETFLALYLRSALHEREGFGSVQVDGRNADFSPLPVAALPGRNRNFSFSFGCDFVFTPLGLSA